MKKVKIFFIQKHDFLLNIVASYSFFGISILCFIFSTPIVLSAVSLSDYGVYIIILNITTLISISNFGFNTTFLIDYHKIKNIDEKNIFISTLLIFTITLALIFGFFILFFNNFIFSYLNISTELGFKLLILNLLILILNIINNFLDSILYSNNKIVKKSIFEILKVILVTLAFTFGCYFSKDVVIGCLSVLIIQFFYSLYFYFNLKADFQINFSIYYFDSKYIKVNLKSSFHFFILSISGYIVFYSDSLLVSSLAGANYVTTYSLHYKLTDLFQKLIFKISDIKLPLIQQKMGDKLNIRQIFNKLFLVTTILVLFSGIFLYIFGNYLFEIWLGSKVVFDKNIITFMILNMIISCMIHVPGVFIIAFKEHQKLSYTSFFEAFLNIIFSYFLFQKYGISGIPMGTLCAILFTSSCYVTYFYFQKIRINN